MKKLALFDIDGVVYDGHSIFDLVQDQEKRGFVKKGLWGNIQKDLESYKSGIKNYKQAADSMLKHYANALKGKKYQAVLEDNLDTISRFKNKHLTYFKKLAPILKVTHETYFVTTNFDFTAEAFTQFFKVDGFLSSRVGQSEGYINGQLELSLGGNKGLVLDLIEKYGKKGSIATGDSENDVDMLDKVEFPLAMEPDEKLMNIAKEKGWEIVNRNTITDIITTHARK